MRTEVRTPAGLRRLSANSPAVSGTPALPGAQNNDAPPHPRRQLPLVTRSPSRPRAPQSGPPSPRDRECPSGGVRISAVSRAASVAGLGRRSASRGRNALSPPTVRVTRARNGEMKAGFDLPDGCTRSVHGRSVKHQQKLATDLKQPTGRTDPRPGFLGAGEPGRSEAASPDHDPSTIPGCR